MDFNFRIAILLIVLSSAYFSFVEPSDKCHCSNLVNSVDISQVTKFSIIYRTVNCKMLAIRVMMKGNKEVCLHYKKQDGKWLQRCLDRMKENPNQWQICLNMISRKGLYTIL
ncbi:uncharacterized protein LOC103182145 [Callorhinchus milii]|uniref:uncharacterized protein LOC103182145 n=1 Tax=Callorhinchus milii TaxID=7868 RepID=UPI0004571A12|nr:uncharacterized protein LOC103182145 [Callorhinchus milii]|eukprot:gi/632937065/ref/XP_007897215.1/ PREDICTED: uncharacterized protein LOC103182145 [Callorhinchus milii]